MTEFKNLKELKDAISEERQKVLRGLRFDYRTVQSRGLYVSWLESGSEHTEWKGTLKDLNATIAWVEKECPEAEEIWISGGYNGADSPQDFQDCVYDPWVASFDVLVWKGVKDESY